MLAVGYGAARWHSPASGPGTNANSAATTTTQPRTDDEAVLTRFGFVDERYPMQFKPVADIKPRSAHELALLMADSTQQQTGSIGRAPDPAPDHAPIPVDGASKLPPIALVIERNPAGVTKSDLPIEVDISSPRNSRVMIGRVPTGVAFTAGQQAGPGVWLMRIGEFAGANILVDGSAPVSFELAVMLLDTSGTVVNGLDISFRVVESGTDQQPPSEIPQSVATTKIGDFQVEDMRIDDVRMAREAGDAAPPAVASFTASATTRVTDRAVAPQPQPRRAFAPPAALGAEVRANTVKPLAKAPDARDVKSTKPGAAIATSPRAASPPIVAASQPLPPPPSPAQTLQSGLSALFPDVKPGEPVTDFGFFR